MGEILEKYEKILMIDRGIFVTMFIEGSYERWIIL
jgi:hypothetical protein